MTEKKKKAEKPNGKLQPESIKIRATFTRPMLGTAPANPDVYSDFIAKKVDKERLADELKSLPQEDLEEKGMTVFHRDDDGDVVLLDYQVKGFIKEAFKAFCEFGEIKLPHGQKVSKYTAQRVVDNFIFIYPFEIKIQMPENGEVTKNVRPLRGQTQQGERVALACSEQVPKGSFIEFTVEWNNPTLKNTVIDSLDYGSKKGIGQWRNSGMGRFEWTEIE